MKCIINLLLAMFAVFSLSAQIPLAGKLLDLDSGKPVAGAVIKTDSSSVHSDEDGTFHVHSFQDTIKISVEHAEYGVTRHVLALHVDSIRIIRLRKHNFIEEVLVSSGFQRIPRERATGSFSFVDQRALQEQVSFDILSMLPAVANSVMTDRPATGSSSLIVRGLSTIRGPNQPLIVLDNFPYEGDLQSINPNTIESATILKDASAASVWGARAGNGVIVLTSKKSINAGRLIGSFNASNTFGVRPDLRYIPQMASADYLLVEEFLFDNGYYNSRINNRARPPLTPMVELLIGYAEGNLTEEEFRSQQNQLQSVDVREGFNRHFYQNSYRQQYFIDLSAGGEKYDWLVSGGFDSGKDELDANSRRVSLRAVNSIRPSSMIGLSTELIYNSRLSTNGKPGYGDISLGSYDLYPYAQFADALGNPLSIAQRREPYIDTLGGGRLMDWRYYPLADHNNYDQRMHIRDITINSGLIVNLWSGVKLNAMYQHKQQLTSGETQYGSHSYFARDLINLYSQVDLQTGHVSYPVPMGNIADLSTNSLRANSVRSQLDVQKRWGIHEMAMIAGSEARTTRVVGHSHRVYGLNADNYTFGHVDHLAMYPEIIRGSSSRIPHNNDLVDRTARFLSFYANASYTFREKYMISASARRDASNLFGLNTNDKWNPFWSAGASWDVGKEPFFPAELFPYARLRATYGFNGNINPGMSALGTVRYGNSYHYYGNRPVAWHDNYPNPDLRWETSRIINLGLDFRTSKNRISGSIELYFKRSFDLFGYMPNDITNGVGQEVLRNSSSISGRGVNFELATSNLERPAISWQTSFNLSFNRDFMEEHYLSTTLGRNFVNTSRPTATPVIGQPVYSIYSYKWAGLSPETGEPVGFLANEKSTSYSQILNSTDVEEMRFHGSALPTVFGSMGNRLTFRDLQLDVRITFKAGYYFRRRSVNYTALFSRGAGHADFKDRWVEAGDEMTTYVPSMAYPSNSGRDAFYSGVPQLVERGDHIRLQYVSLSYQISRYKIYLNANNLGMLWRANSQRIDPDYHGMTTIPPRRNLSIGVRANF